MKKINRMSISFFVCYFQGMKVERTCPSYASMLCAFFFFNKLNGFTFLLFKKARLLTLDQTVYFLLHGMHWFNLFVYHQRIVYLLSLYSILDDIYLFNIVSRNSLMNHIRNRIISCYIVSTLFFNQTFNFSFVRKKWHEK